MTVEYILLMSVFIIFVIGVFFRGPSDAFKNAAPKLAARVEQNLITGDSFSRGVSEEKKTVWREE